MAVRGFRVGIDVPVRGHTLVADCRLDNEINVRITSPVQPAGGRYWQEQHHSPSGRPGDVDYDLADPDCTFNGDLSLLFDRDVLLVEDPGSRADALLPGAAPGRGPVPGRRRSSSSAARRPDSCGRSTGWPWPGRSPRRTRTAAGVRGLVGPVTDDVRAGWSRRRRRSRSPGHMAAKEPAEEYTLDQNRDRVRFVQGPAGRAVRVADRDDPGLDGRPRSRDVLRGRRGPALRAGRCVKLEIHPDDVKHGIEICGMLHDEVAGCRRCKNMLKEFRDLKVDPDGYVTVNYACTRLGRERGRAHVPVPGDRGHPPAGAEHRVLQPVAVHAAQEPAAAPARKRSRAWWWVGGVVGLALAGGLAGRTHRRHRGMTAVA